MQKKLQNKVKYVIIKLCIIYSFIRIMRVLNKILLVSAVFVYATLNLVLADDSDDCKIFGSDSYKQEWSANNWFPVVDIARQSDYFRHLMEGQKEEILGKDDLNTALLNLKKYCCENGIWWIADGICKKDAEFFNENALDSQYLFDHIFDVMMRRLNWLTGESDVYAKTKMSIDKKWNERRNRIDKKALDFEWSDAQTIINEYNKYWTKSDVSLWYDILDNVSERFIGEDHQTFLKYVSWELEGNDAEESKKVARAIKNYDKWTLADRYNNVCALDFYFYALLNLDSSSMMREHSDVYSLCKNAVEQQIEEEDAYVQVVIQEASNLFLSNYIEWYLKYLYDRWIKLKSLWRDSTDRWLDVARAVPHLTNKCGK